MLKIPRKALWVTWQDKGGYWEQCSQQAQQLQAAQADTTAGFWS